MIGASTDATPELLTSAFEQLVQSSSGLIEHTELRRSIHEAVTTRPGPVQSQWTQWFFHAGRSLGLTIDLVTVSAETAFDLADCGATLMTWHDSTGRFLIVDRSDPREVQDFWTDAPMDRTRSSPTRLTSLVADDQPDVANEWIVFTSTRLQQDEPVERGHTTPLQRLWKIMKPEMSDLWVLLVLALVIALLATAVPIAGQQLVRTVTFGTLYQPIIVLSLVLLLFLAFMGALQALHVFVVELMQQRIFARTVAELSFRLPRSDFRALQRENGPELLNRFLDIAIVQKVVAGLLVDGFALVLTTVIGMTLIAFYHPFLLGYDLVLAGLLWFVVLVLGRGGARTAIRESQEKYRVAAWLQEMARCPLAFRLAGGADFAVARADRLTSEYLDARRRHFRVLLRQILGLFAIQALASTTLLGLGGYLVMNEQLSLGQLVAAELIVTMIVGSFAKLSKHIEGYFDLMGSMNKLGHLFDLPLERRGRSLVNTDSERLVEISMVRFVPCFQESRPNAYYDGSAGTLRLNSGQHTAVWGESRSGKSRLADALYGLDTSAEGIVLIGGSPVRDLRPEELRRKVALIRDVEILAATIEENLHLGRTEVDAKAIHESLSITGLRDELNELPLGLSTELVCDGAPLSDSQRVRLMIARALAARPSVLVIDGLLDRLSDDLLDPLLRGLQTSDAKSTLLVFTGRRDLALRFSRSWKLTPLQERVSESHFDHHHNGFDPHAE